MASTVAMKSIGSPPAAVVPLQSVVALCKALQDQNVRYCHWKSNNALDRSATGDNDLDLLIARADATRFAGILSRCGFKLVNAPAEKQMPGVQDFFAYDATADKCVHVHAHFRLVCGHDFSKNYRLEIEDAYLESAVQGDLFKLPAPEFEFIVFVIRMVLKHSTWDSIATREGRLRPAERREFQYLSSRVDPLRINDSLEYHLPYIGLRLFWHGVESLAVDSSVWHRARTAHRLETRLCAHGRRGQLSDVVLRLSRRVWSLTRRHLGASPRKYRFATGGAVIAIVGGDGAGKSTAIDGLHQWLSRYFDSTRVHLGKTPWSPFTKIVRGFLKIVQLLGLYGLETSYRDTLAEKSLISPGYPYLIREVCRARDRYRTYVKAKRRSGNGALVICDRFPLPQIKLMDGPLARSFVRDLSNAPGANQRLSPRASDKLVKFLIRLEEDYYSRIVRPESLMVLRVHPDIAVQRRHEEPELDVRERSTEIWNIDWRDTEAHVVDASQSKASVLAELKTFIWAQL